MSAPSSLHELERRVQDLTEILKIARSLTAEKNLDELLHLIIESATRVMDADRSSLFLVDEEKQELYSKIAQGSREIRFPIGSGIAGVVAQTKTIINIPDAYQEARFNQEFDRKSGYRTRTILCAPLVTHEGKVVGVLQVLNKSKGVFTDYDEYLLQALANHAAIALDNAQLIRHYLEKQRLQQSLSIAREIQQSFFPRIPPHFETYDIYGTSLSCDETGGDYFDFIPLTETQMAIVVGDVSGHGLGSALVMVSARASLIGFLDLKLDISQILNRMNHQMVRDNSSEKFMTLLLGVLDMEQNTFQYTSAGHDAPLFFQNAYNIFQELDSTGIPLGMIDDEEFPKSPLFPIVPGDILLFATDGVWETMNETNETFGKDRIIDLIRKNGPLNAKEIVELILRELKQFSKNQIQRDDITLIILKRKPVKG